MANTITIGRDEAVTVAPTTIEEPLGTPVRVVQLMIRRGVICLNRQLTLTEAEQIGRALLEAAGVRA